MYRYLGKNWYFFFLFVSVMKINFNNLVVWQMINQIKSKHINIIDFFGVNNDDDFCQLQRYYLYLFFGLVIRSMFVVWWPFAYSKIIINNIETLRFDRSIDQSIDHFRWSFFRSIHRFFSLIINQIEIPLPFDNFRWKSLNLFRLFLKKKRKFNPKKMFSIIEKNIM